MSPREYFTIGEVVLKLKPRFSDLSVSKIRFLEETGLIKPMRTPSGYRKFLREDIERLEIILRLQSEHFFPHSVIKEKLDDMDLGIPIKELLEKDEQSDEQGIAAATKPLEYQSAVQKLGVSIKELNRLEEFGLFEPLVMEGKKYIPEDSIAFVQASQVFLAFGHDARHLKKFFGNPADSATHEVYSILSQVYRYKSEESRKQLREKIDELSKNAEMIYAHQFRKLLTEKLKDFI